MNMSDLNILAQRLRFETDDRKISWDECAQLFDTTVRTCTVNGIPSPFCCTLTELLLAHDKKIGINGVCTIIDALASNPTGCALTRMMFFSLIEKNSSNSVMEKQLAEKFVTLLQHDYTKLKSLRLSYNSLGDDFLTIFVTGLKYNKQLKDLNLCNNVFTSTGANALAHVLYYNTTLTDLNLSDNKISDSGTLAITCALRYHPTIECLNLSNNHQTSDSCFAKALLFLQYNESMTHLFLWSMVPACDKILSLKQTIEDYNDTLINYRFSSEPHFPALKIYSGWRARRTVRKKGCRRRQDAYAWLYNDWICHNDNTSRAVTKRRLK